MPQPYVSRPEAEAFLAALADAIKAPKESPVVFHVYGIGGVGKSTLLRRVIETFPQAAMPIINELPIKFGETEGIGTPVDLMKKLHGLLESQFLSPSLFGRSLKAQPDPFTERYTQYFDAIHQLNSTSPDGKSGASAEQLSQVKQLLKGLTQGGGALATMTGNPVVGGALAAASKGTDAVVDGASLALSEKDRVQSLVQSHKATRDKRELQELLLDPLPHLTQAFVKSLSQWSAQKPIVLMLDTYEKADLATIDLWLWRSLLSNTDLRRYPIRLVVAGRYNLLNRQEWQTVQQTSELVKPYGPEKFTAAQTQAYLAEIGIVDPATVERIYQTTKGWPYYLNKIRETQPTLDLDSLNQNLATFLVNHLSAAEQAAGEQLAQLAACCRWFDGQMIELLAQQLQLVPPLPQGGVAQPQGGCLAWLREQTFVEPLTGGRWRLDDVARDVFRKALRQADLSRFQRTHDLLARYSKAKSNQVVAAQTPTSEKYENPDWREPRAEYLYHLAFTPSATLQITWLSHVLEATYLKQTGLVSAPLQGITEDYALAEHPYLAYTTRRFLQRLSPVVEYGWLVLEKGSIFNKAILGLNKDEIEQAVAICLDNPNQFEGLAKFAALFYKAKRCAEGQQLTCLQQAQAQAEQLLTVELPDFLAELFLYQLGNSFYDANSLEKAIACYDVALTLKPEKCEAFNNKGNALAALGNYVGAIACYDDALALKPELHGILNNKGLALALLGDKAGAITCYNQALAIKPNFHETLYNKGLALAALGNKTGAITFYDAALEIKPDDHQALYNKGNALAALGDKAGAIVCYDTALAIKPNYYEALTNKGSALAALGDYAGAIACYDTALKIKPDFHEALNNKGHALSDLGDKVGAIACYDAALKIKPDDYQAFYNKGNALYDLGNQAGAIAWYDAALAVKPDYYQALTNKGVALATLGDNAGAIACYEPALALKPNDHQAHYNKGLALATLGNHAGAIACFDAALFIKPDDYGVLYNKGLALAALGDHAGAIYYFNAVLAINPNDHESLYNKGTVLVYLGQKEGVLAKLSEGIACYKAALTLKPDYHEALINKGVALAALGDNAGAIACYEDALVIKPDDYEALNNKGVALAALAQKEGALAKLSEGIACYEAALALKSNYEEALYNKGNALSALENHASAIICYDAALAIKPDFHQALTNKGEALSALGDHAGAIACYSAALTIKPDFHEALYNKGVALSALTNYAGAVAYFNAALAIKPDFHEALCNKGIALGYLGRYGDAITAHDQALTIQPNNPKVVYNKACCYGLRDDADNALPALQIAIALDPKYRTMAKTDTDFDPIRTDERFQALLAEE